MMLKPSQRSTVLEATDLDSDGLPNNSENNQLSSGTHYTPGMFPRFNPLPLPTQLQEVGVVLSFIFQKRKLRLRLDIVAFKRHKTLLSGRPEAGLGHLVMLKALPGPGPGTHSHSHVGEISVQPTGPPKLTLKRLSERGGLLKGRFSLKNPSMT